MENDDFRGPFGITILVKTVIFIKLEGGFQPMMVIWSGRFGSPPVVVLVICEVAVRRQLLRLTVPILTPKVPCGGKGDYQKTRQEVLTRDLTRPGPRPGEYIYIYIQ